MIYCKNNTRYNHPSHIIILYVWYTLIYNRNVCQIILTDTIISSSTSNNIAIDIEVGEGERLVGTKVAHDNLCLGYQVSIVVSIVIGINIMIFIFLNLL